MRANLTREPWTSRHRISRTTNNTLILSEEIIGGQEYKMILRNIQGCQKCQQNKVQHIKKTEKLYLLEIPQEP